MKKLKQEVNKLGLDNNVNLSLKQEYIKALKSEEFKTLISKLHAEEEVLMKYTTKLQESAAEYKNCQMCKNILECKNDVSGFCYFPEVTGKGVNFSYIACNYKKEIDKKNKYQENIYHFDIPREIREAKMVNIHVSDKNRTEIIHWIKDFITNYDKGKTEKGLFLHGNFGSGKTYLISAMFNQLAKKGEKVAVIYWPEFLRDLKASFSDDFVPKFNYIKKVPLLLIDDIGAENSTPWARDEILGPILQYRMQEKLPTFFTSNLNIEELEVHFSNSGYKSDQVKAKRIIERIKQLTNELTLVSKNKRN